MTSKIQIIAFLLLVSLPFAYWALKRLLVAVPNYFAVMSSTSLKPHQKGGYGREALPFIQFYYIVIFGVVLLDVAVIYFIIKHVEFIH